ncbi:MAG: single-stranded DNA-binding protein [Oscillospiraceae bacterium]|nr:single-stranded DNA-binding protein [Oscillospiraceae bacterium]
MLNRVILMGRITRDLDLRQTQGGTSVLSFTVAVDRAPAKQGGERQTDFINCVAFGQRAEFISRYFGKGRMIAIEGSIRTGSYDRDGQKHYTTDIWVDSASFTGEPRQEGSFERSYSNSDSQGSYQQNRPAQNNFTSAPNNSDIDIGSLSDYEEAIGDEDVPF